MICGTLLITFWVRAQVAIRGKSSTYDEPMHSLGAWVHWHHGDWRINYEDPPLWQYWAALPNGVNAIKADFDSSKWKLMASQWEQQWLWSVETLYRTQGNDGEAFVQRSRAMMIVLGVAVGALLAWWGYSLGGAVCATAAAALFALDPNFLGHAPLVKNDVSMALCVTGLCCAVWRMGRRVTPLNLAGASLACAAAMATKFSGVLLAPLFATALLLTRAAMPSPWLIWNWTAVRAWQRFAGAMGFLIVIGLISYAGVWVVYGLHFSAMPDDTLRLNTPYILEQAKSGQTHAQLGNYDESDLTDPEKARVLNERFARLVEEWKPDGVLRTLGWMLERKLFPEAWLNGLMFVQARSYLRGSFLDGQHSVVGFKRYFPLAMAYKTPLATIAALLAAVGCSVWLFLRDARSAKRASASVNWFAPAWIGCCVGLPVIVYMWVSINSNLNIGFRHVLPIYPLLFLAAAGGLALVWRRWRRIGIASAALLGIGLAVESVAIAPDYITFFNAAVGGQRGGLDRLGDSNLDWGQDLPALAEFMQSPANRDAPLYLCYFGMVDPAFYGLRYLNMPGGYELNRQVMSPTSGSIVAISATRLQGIYLPESLRAQYEAFRNTEPAAVLGGTIYVHDLRRPQVPASR